MLSAGPQISEPGDWDLGQRWGGVGAVVILGDQQQIIDFLLVETRQRQIEVRLVQLLNFKGQQFFVKVGPGRGSIHEQAERLHLRIGPLVAENHRDCGHVAAGPGSQLLRTLQPEVTIHYGSAAAGKHRDLEAKFADAGAHAIHGRIVFPWVANIKHKAVYVPENDLH